MSCLLDALADVGTTKRVEALFWTLDDPALPVDPTTVSCLVRDPLGNEAIHSVERDRLGEFFAEVFVPMPGQWRYRFTSSAPIRVREGSFVVRRSIYGTSQPSTEPISSAWGASPWGSFAWPAEQETTLWGNAPWGTFPWGA